MAFPKFSNEWDELLPEGALQLFMHLNFTSHLMSIFFVTTNKIQGNYFIEFLQTTKGGKKFKGRNYSRKSDLMEIHDVLEYMQGLRNHCSPLQRISTPCVSSYKQCSLSIL